MCVWRRVGGGEEMKVTADIVYHYYWWYAGVDCSNYLGRRSNA
jgi:hypothetical protein